MPTLYLPILFIMTAILSLAPSDKTYSLHLTCPYTYPVLINPNSDLRQPFSGPSYQFQFSPFQMATLYLNRQFKI